VSGKVYSFPNIGPAKRLTEDAETRRPPGSARREGAWRSRNEEGDVRLLSLKKKDPQIYSHGQGGGRGKILKMFSNYKRSYKSCGE